MFKRAVQQVFALWLACAPFGCSDSDADEACSVVAPSTCLEPELRYADVAPIFERQCASCHTGVGTQPWPLDSYENVADWTDLVRDELVSCSMPPRDAPSTLSNRDRARILNWLRCGLRE